MRILQIIQRPQRRGAEIFASQLANLHRERGHTVSMISLFHHTSAGNLTDGDIEIPSLGLVGDKRLLDFKGWRALAGVIEKFSADIVQANAADTLKYAVMSRKLYSWSAPLVYRNANVVSAFIKSPLHRMYNRRLLREPDGFACVSQTSQDDLATNFGVPSEKLHYAPIGVTIPERCRRKEARDWVEEKLGVPSQAKILIHCGAFCPEKNHLGLLEIVSALKAGSRSPLCLLLFGQGPMEQVIRRQAEKQGVHELTHFLGNREDYLRWLPAADVFLLPSLIEGLPGVLLEAMANRVPVVASPVGGVPEIVKNGKTGRLIDFDDIDGFSNAVLEILQDKLMRELIVNNAYELVSTNYDLPGAAERFMKIYESVICRQNPTSSCRPRPKAFQA